MKIGERVIDDKHYPYVVAEIGAGHCGSLDIAMDLVRDAYRAKADAVKLQTYTPASMTLPSKAEAFQIKGGHWAGNYLWDLYEKAMTPREWHEPLFDEARRLGITMFSTPFSPDDVDFLEGLGCPAYKVASCEIAHLELLEAIRETGKPVILSTGMASMQDIRAARDALYGRDAALLHCVSGYPTKIAEANLWGVKSLQSTFPHLQVGLSDHTRGTDAAALAVALGATIVEKHIGERESLDGEFAMPPMFFGRVVVAVRDAWDAMQETDPLSEVPSRALRRSIWTATAIRAGERITREDLAIVRPAGGLDPADLPLVVGSVATRDIEPFQPLTQDMFRQDGIDG